MSTTSRRQFVTGTLATAATVTIAGTKSSGRVLGANDTIRVAVAGLNGRGDTHVGEFAGREQVTVTHLVDPDTRTFARRVKQAESKKNPTPKTVQDIRRVLDDKSVDVISIATPNHWHALMTLWACQAGKDVYVEKPCSHNIHEGRIAVEAAHKFGRIVQHGTQNRSSGDWARVMAVIASGQLGKLLISRGLCYKAGFGPSTRGSIGFRPSKPVPAELDFNLWLGPAKEQPFHENLLHYRWHWFWDFGNGDLGNQGVHQMDLARWAIPGATLPRKVFSLGGRFVGDKGDQGEAANTQLAVFDFGETKLIFEVRGLPSLGYRGQSVGNIFHLEAGTIVGTKFFPKGSDKPAPLPAVEARRGPGGGHFGNFLAAVRSRKPSDLNAELLEGHYSSALCHLANAAFRLGKEVPVTPRPSGLDPAVGETLERMEEHLRSNAHDLSRLKWRMSPVLTFDPRGERFVEQGEVPSLGANRLLTREYRAPFVVPPKLS